MLTRGATNYEWGLRGACEGGHRCIADMMLTRGATDYEWGLRGACQGEHFDIALWLIDKCGRLLSETSPTSPALIDNLGVSKIIQLLNIGLDPELKHINTNHHIKQKMIERQRVLNNIEKILNNCVPRDIINHVISTYVRYE
jgi:hypothetical protein